VASTLEHAQPFLRRLSRPVLRLAVLALAAGAVAWWGIGRAVPSGDARGPVLAVTAVLLLIPPVILFLFVLAVRALIGLPGRLRAVPGAVRGRLADIARHSGAMTAAGRGSALARLRSLFRLGWSVASSREVIEVLGPAAVLVTPWMLAASAVAAVAAVIEIVVGTVALVWLAVA
jgi:hypothetical protein